MNVGKDQKQPNVKNNISKDRVSIIMETRKLNDPLSKFTDGQMKNLYSELGRTANRKIIELFGLLNNNLINYDPISLISNLSVLGHFKGVGDNGVQSRVSVGDFYQIHVELIQALALQIPENEYGSNPVTPEIVQEVRDKLLEITSAFSFNNINEMPSESSQTDFAISRIQNIIRGNTQMVRNWGHFTQVLNVPKDIYSYFDSQINEKCGFSATNAIDVFKLIAKLVEERLNNRYKDLKKLKSEKNLDKMLVRYFEIIGQGKEETDIFAEKIDINQISNECLYSMLLSHHYSMMHEFFHLDSNELSSRLSIRNNVVDNVLKKLSYKFGDINDSNKEFFFLDNPVWNRPIISSSRGYYCFLPQTFFSYVLCILDEIVEKIDKKALHNRRAEYLEQKIKEIVESRFPKSQVKSSVKWGQYESDLIAFIDSHAIIIEAKSHKISKSALRGAPDRVRRHLNDILIKPSIQSYRLEKKLKDLKLQISPNDSLLTKLPVDIKSINKVLRVSVSLEDFAALQSNMWLFDDAEWMPNDFVKCPSMNLADFETLFDILQHPVQIIHYLTRRTELDSDFKIFGDELDYLGFYITNLFNYGNHDAFSNNQSQINISGYSESLDNYYQSKDCGKLIDKPQPKVSGYFRNILCKLEKKGIPRWTEMGGILYRISVADQCILTNRLNNEKNISCQHKDYKNIINLFPHDSPEYALAIVLYKDWNRDYLGDYIINASEIGLKHEHVKCCLVIAINFDRYDCNDSPYHRIELVEG